jgi:N utilization substance protein A
VSELGGEKIDVVNWSVDPAIFIANALSPAQVVSVKVDEKRKSAMAVIPDKVLSLAIGKEGQNVRLAVRLTGWNVDIKNASEAGKEKAEEEASKVSRRADKAVAEKETLAETPPVAPVAAGAAEGKKALRFSEDILSPAAASDATGNKDKKKKKKTGKEHAEDGIRLKKARRGSDVYDTEDDI